MRALAANGTFHERLPTDGQGKVEPWHHQGPVEKQEVSGRGASGIASKMFVCGALPVLAGQTAARPERASAPRGGMHIHHIVQSAIMWCMFQAVEAWNGSQLVIAECPPTLMPEVGSLRRDAMPTADAKLDSPLRQVGNRKCASCNDALCA